ARAGGLSLSIDYDMLISGHMIISVTHWDASFRLSCERLFIPLRSPRKTPARLSRSPIGYRQGMDTADLRPLERRILEMRDQGLSLEEIGKRFRKSPEFVSRVIGWTQIPRNGTDSRDSAGFTPLERRVLQLRGEDEDHQTIADRFKKSARFIRQVEGMAHFRMGLRILSEAADAARAGDDDLVGD
ncbi:MAG: hypothetical protein ACRDVL_13740, partial [Acidimicrobiia bacterium]